MSSDFHSTAAERLPRNHRAVLAVLQASGNGRHLTAQDVFARARAARPNVGFATVHRALARLHELGLVLKLDVPGASSAVYEPAATPHAHFRCTQCGRIDDIDFAVPNELRAQLASRHGIEIAAEATTFAGRCATCCS